MLCNQQESRRPRTKTQQYLLHQGESSKAIQTPNDKVKVDLSVLDEQVLLRSPFYSPFCRVDEEAGPKKCNKLFSRIDGLRKHIRIQHPEYMRPKEGFVCQYQGCMASLESTM